MPWRFDSLEFESGVFGAPVGRVNFTGGKGLSLASLRPQWVAQGTWLVSARIRDDDDSAAEDLHVCGFVPIETLVTLERPVSPAAHRPERVRAAEPADRAACLEIARSVFVHDRFHADERVPEPLADAYKKTWVANALDGRADRVLVVEVAGRVAGFITCMRHLDVGVIDLIAVAPAHRGQGIGKDLVAGMMAHYANCVRGLRVGTQTTNSASLSLYAAHGFEPVTRKMTFHWVNPGVAP